MTRVPDVVVRAHSFPIGFGGFSSCEFAGYCWFMLKRVDIMVDDDLLQEVIRRYHLADAREAVHLALKALLDEDGGKSEEEEYDEFSDLSAWELRRSTDTR